MHPTGTPPAVDYTAPATRLTSTIDTTQRTRMRVQLVEDAGWPHIALTALTPDATIRFTFGLDDAHLLAAGLSRAVVDLQALYEPTEQAAVA